MRHDLSGDQLEMVNVIKVDHLQVGALGASLGEGRQPLDDLGGAARGAGAPQLLRVGTDAPGTPAQLVLTGGTAHRHGVGVHQRIRVAPGLLTG